MLMAACPKNNRAAVLQLLLLRRLGRKHFRPVFERKRVVLGMRSSPRVLKSGKINAILRSRESRKSPLEDVTNIAVLATGSLPLLYAL